MAYTLDEEKEEEKKNEEKGARISLTSTLGVCLILLNPADYGVVFSIRNDDVNWYYGIGKVIF